MNYVFFGTPRFAEIILEKLIDVDMIPAALVCNPDRPFGRKKIITPPLTKKLVIDRKISTVIFQPETIDEDFIKQLKDLKPDFFVVAAYTKIIPDTVLSIPRLGTLGTHPSLLPRYRGASPIQSVILAGQTVTGSTIYQMDARMDHGPIYIQKSIALEPLSTNYIDLEEQLAKISGDLLINFIPELLAGTLKPPVQNEDLATFTKKFETQDGFIDLASIEAAQNGDRQKTEIIVRTINALNPEPGVWTMKDGKRVKLLEATIIDGTLKLTKTQIEGETAKEI